MRRRFVLLLGLLLLLATLAGCQTGSPLPTPVPSLQVGVPPTSPPEAIGTAQPDATATPLPPLAPRLLSQAPAPGEELALDGALELVFDQPMDRASVEAALSLTPELAGAIEWPTDDTLRFVPAAGVWERDRVYGVTLAASARSATQLELAREISFHFRTVGYLEVADVFPRPESEDVDPATPITIVFNRPVVPLTAIQSQGELPDPLRLNPEAPGKGAWVSTSVYRFAPAERLLAGTTYTVALDADLEASGATLKEGYAWSFATQQPAVIAVLPFAQASLVDPSTAITLTFNQAMDADSVEERFTLSQAATGEPVSGEIAWEDLSLRFTPDEPLLRGADYAIALAAGAQAAEGEATIQREGTWRFQVAPLPRVVRSVPAQGETSVDLWQSLQINFSAPMDAASVKESLTITPTVNTYQFWQNDDTELWISLGFRPSTRYTVTITSEATDRFGVALAEPYVLSFVTRAEEPSVSLLTQGPVGVYNSYTDDSISVRHVNVSRVDLELYALSADGLLDLTRDGGWPDWNRFQARPQDLIASWSQRTAGALNETRTFTTRLAPDMPGRLPSGIYVLRAMAPEASHVEHHVLVVTPMNVTLKTAPDMALVWVTDLSDGAPMADVEVVLYGNTGREADRGRTDADGLLTLDVPEQGLWESLLAIAYDGEAIGAAQNQWSDGISPWYYDLPVSWEVRPYTGYFYTERRIYRPGQTVFFKGFLRADDDAHYSLPPADVPVQVVLMDSQGRQVWQDTLSLNDVGSVDGQVLLGEDAPLGYYVLTFTFGDQYFEAPFQVAEYRRPEFQVTVETDQAECVAGTSLQVDLAAEFFFGGPVSDADVLWRVFAEPYYFDRYQGDGYYSFGDYGMDDPEAGTLDLGLLTEGRGRTDADGHLTVTVPTELQGSQSRRFVIQVSVVDINNQEITGQASAIVHRGGLYVGLTAESYVGTSGKPMAIGVLTVDTQGQTLARRSVELVVSRVEWLSVQQRGADGNYYWENEVRSTPVHTETVLTDAKGQARLTFVPSQGGTYKVAARATDEAGNVVRSALYVWVSDRTFVNWGQEDNNRIELVADKKSYAPGDTASILIPSPFQEPVTALLTIERGTILEYRLIELESNSELLELPILPEYAPNVFVSVVLVRGMGDDVRDPGFRLGYVMLPVSPKQQELQVTITPDSADGYQPRDEATFTIQVSDYAGRPAQAEVAVQMVDLAIESLVGGEPPDIVAAFYGERGLAVNTALSLVRRRAPEVPDVAGKEGKGGGGGDGSGEGLRTEFPDTALWLPSVRTGADGTATVSVTLPDNLTTWRVTAQAVTESTLVGRGQADIVSNLEIMIRPSVPRFLVIDDEPTLGAVIHNNTAEDLEIQVALEATGLMFFNANQTIPVPAGGRRTVQWPATVAPVDEVQLTYTAQAGGHRDATRITIPVYHASTPEVVGTSGVVEDRVIEALRLPEEVMSRQGGLTVNLEPSLAASMRAGLEYLETYPYGCIEQTVSSFLPNVATFRALADLGIRDAKLAARLPQQVAIGLQRLYALQGPDGGWGWWGDRDSSPLISAYVLFGMAQAREAGFIVDASSMDRAVAYLYNWLNDTQPVSQDHYNTRAAVLYALAEADQGDLARAVALFDDRSQLSLFAKAYLAMTLHLLEPDEAARVEVLENEFVEAAMLSATGMHWQETSHSPWQMSTDTRTNAMVLRALVWLDPEQALLPQAVRWLTMARSSGRWETTQENVWAILALTDYMVATGELQADYGYSLSLNGVEQVAGQVTPATVTQPVTASLPIEELTPGQDSYVLIERQPEDAAGRLYYSAFLQYYLPTERIQPLDRGVIVYREYSLADDPDRPITSARVNDIVKVKLTLIAPHDVYYLVLEDAYPAGCEGVDTSLATTRRVEEMDPGLEPVIESEWDYDYWWFTHWPTHTEMRDEKLVLFASELARGTYQFQYQLRCTTPGFFRVMPALAYQMYEPDVFGRSEGLIFEVQP